MPQPTIFISYSHKDETEKNALVTQLGVLQNAGLIDLWVDDRIEAGGDWKAKIEQAINQAQVAILLITANFLTSKFILEKEVPRLLDRRQREGLVVFPVIARACPWDKVGWLVRMNVRPKNGTPIWHGTEHDEEALAAVAREVADIIDRASKDVIKLDLTITWDGDKNKSRMALVLAADKHTTFGALVELLVERWDLPVWQDKPIAYDLYTQDNKVLDLSKSLGDLKVGQNTRLCLVAVADRLVVAQSPADIPSFEVWHPDTKTSVSVLVLPGAITVSELQDRLEQLWNLPLFHGEELVHYELWSRNRALPLDQQLPEPGMAESGMLALVRRPGVPVIPYPDTGEIAGEEVESELPKAEPAFEIELVSYNGDIAPVETSQKGTFAPVSAPGPAKKMSEQEFRKHLLQALDEGLGEAELEKLLFNLDLPSDYFTGNKMVRIIGLIQYCRRYNKLDELLVEACTTFPHVKGRLIERGCATWLPHVQGR